MAPGDNAGGKFTWAAVKKLCTAKDIDHLACLAVVFINHGVDQAKYAEAARQLGGQIKPESYKRSLWVISKKIKDAQANGTLGAGDDEDDASPAPGARGAKKSRAGGGGAGKRKPVSQEVEEDDEEGGVDGVEGESPEKKGKKGGAGGKRGGKKVKATEEDDGESSPVKTEEDDIFL